ncbi:MAG: hypothetical protein AAF598_08005 [Bacteroidota bacterium]
MDPIFKKMNLKEHSPILVLDAPAAFLPSIQNIKGLTDIHQSPQAGIRYDFYLAFVEHQVQLDQRILALPERITEGDTVVWFTYPKKSSKQYKSNITRDQGWQGLGTLSFEGVRSVAIDRDWSALRFRKVKYIKVMKRNPKWRMT